MKELFSGVLEISLAASILIGVVLLLRMILKPAPKIFSYLLWGAVLFKLLCPVSIPVEIPLPREHVQVTQTVITPISGTGADLQPLDNQHTRPAPSKAKASAIDVIPMIWFSGAACMLLICIHRYRRMMLSLKNAELIRGNIYRFQEIDNAFVAGILKPRIYLPIGLTREQTRYVLAHERCHIRRMDHITRPLAYVALSIHWFNPLVWIAFWLSGRDMEMSCDEAVVHRYDRKNRADYAQTLLTLSTRQHFLSPLGFGEASTKVRIKNMANWKKMNKRTAFLCTLLTIAVFMFSACTPKTVTPEKAPATETAATEENAGETETSVLYEDISIPDSHLTLTDLHSNGCDVQRDGVIIGGIFELTMNPEEIQKTDMDDLKWFELLKEPMEGMKAGDYDFKSSGGRSGEMVITFYHPDLGEYTHYVFSWEDRAFDLWISPDSISAADSQAINDFFFPSKKEPDETLMTPVVFKNITETSAEAWKGESICGGIVLMPLTDLKDDNAIESALADMLKAINDDPMEKITKEVPSYAEVEYTTYNDSGVYDHYLFVKDGNVYDLWFNRLGVLPEVKYEAVQKVLAN